MTSLEFPSPEWLDNVLGLCFFLNKVGYAVRRNAHRKWCLNSIINDDLLDHWNVGRGTVEFVICHWRTRVACKCLDVYITLYNTNCIYIYTYMYIACGNSSCILHSPGVMAFCFTQSGWLINSDITGISVTGMIGQFYSGNLAIIPKWPDYSGWWNMMLIFRIEYVKICKATMELWN